MLSSSPRSTYAVVQIQAFKFKHLDTAVYDDLCDLVPCHDHWDNLVEDFKHEEPGFLTNMDNVFLNEDVIGMMFSSVGDWCGYGSFFDHEVDNLSLFEVVEPFREAILADLEFGEEDQCSMLTLWEGVTWRDYWGEYEFEFDYLGVMRNLRAAL